MSSRSHTDLSFAVGGNAWLKKAKGLSSCKSSGPMPYTEASVSTINCLEKSGRASIGILVWQFSETGMLLLQQVPIQNYPSSGVLLEAK